MERLTSCLATILQSDYDYALCVMNSGFFELSSTPFQLRNSTSSLISSPFITPSSSNSLPVTALGSCSLTCTTPSPLRTSSSCCAAATAVLNCPQSTTPSSSSNISDCRSVIHNAIVDSQQCSLASANIVLLVSVAILVTLLLAATIAARLNARNQVATKAAEGLDEDESLEQRLAAVKRPSKWRALLTSWRQVTNLLWKNLVIRRRKPVSFLLELFLPVLLTLALVFIANVDTIFGTGNPSNGSSTEAAAATTTTSQTILCTALDQWTDYGALSTNMSTFYTSGQSVIGLFLLVSYMKFVSTTTTTMVSEKETRIREVMKIMGLSNFTLLCSWCLTTAILTTPLSFVIAAELKFGQVFPMTTYATLVFLFWTLSLSIVSFSYFITPFFNKARAASIASVLLWLLLFFPFFFVMSKSNATRYLGALAPPTAFALGIDSIVRHAQLGRGVAYAIEIAEFPVTVPTAFAMSWFLILDSFILVALGWYFDNVLPQEFGIRKPWNFLFVKDFWRPLSSTAVDRDVVVLESPSMDSPPRTYKSFASPQGTRLSHHTSTNRSIVMMKDRPEFVACMEAVDATLAAQERKGTCLQIRGLRKEFALDNGEVNVAVGGLDLTLYTGQITALLGHNGAGKTTTISMLTGLIPPTSGNATLYGLSLREDLNELRQIMGVCPQHDVLFDELTVDEHLLLFGTMKHIPRGSLKMEAERMIREVGLTEKRKTAARDLSGGQKRKLSLALAFMGDSKLIFLDEPTSGMDPYSRRSTWDLLQRNRDDRVILLSTHFMDEADILGDRITIMADGQLCCAGSSLFLKNRYGAGYHLTMIQAPGCDVEAVGTFLRGFVAEAKCFSNFGSEVVFQLPSKSVGAFSKMLQALDDEMPRLRIVQYGVSVTTLEEVFLRISRDREEEAAIDAVSCSVETVNQIRKTSASSAYSRSTVTSPMSIECTNGATLWTQYTALLTKRLCIAKRDKKNLLNTVCIPLIFLIILVSLPDIDVASFMPTDDYATELASQGQCTSERFSLVSTSSFCDSFSFNYCKLDVIDCSASTCCDPRNVQSPYYACNRCEGTSSTNAVTPCYNKHCLDDDGARLQVTLNAILTSIVVMLALAFVPATIVAFVVREKSPTQNAKSLQLISGASVSAYWLSTWTHDFLIILVWGVVCLIGSHALVVIPMAYLFSFKFEKHAVAQTSLLVFALCTGGLLSIFSFLCRLIDFDLTASSSSNLTLSSLDRNYLRWIFLLFPGYSLNSGIYEIATRKLTRHSLYSSDTERAAPPSFFGLWKGLGTDYTCESCWDAPDGAPCCERNVFDVDVAGAPIAYAVVEFVIFMLLVFVIDNRSLSWRPEQQQQPRNEDDDVATERQRVEQSLPTQNDSVFIRNLRHEYGRKGKLALDNLCLSVARGECFGYLGINGAGKSTTMKVLTGEMAPTNGYVTLGGYDLARDRNKARHVIGYCPQFDPLHDLLTVEEQLELYARLKGIPSDCVDNSVDQTIENMGLTEYRAKLTQGLSGGNKRKLSTAIAMIGDPSVILLDEPSTGVDPSSRRKMWDVIANVCATKKSCVILTTHNMEECEALCTRVGILVSGQLKCLGSVEHLKQKFGRGYIVEVKLQQPPAFVLESLQRDVYQILGDNSPGISRHHVASLCSSLEVPKRAQEILDGENNGRVLTSYFGTSGVIPVDIFCAWWATENMYSTLQEFFHERFPGCQLIEHQGGHFRFQVPKQSLRPYAIFGLLEENKEMLHVREYGVSATSLEYIFNEMAVQQQEDQLQQGSAR
uniref:ABC transporter domain-containing protein n=1 Tax=Peronospora matthiolae TaxID=2874970 RepID=A0AAV1VE52_9STRA